jgi:hypothetical protein
VSDHGTCTISLADASPGDEVHEVMTITNTSGGPYTLSLQASGVQNSNLWNPAPSPDALEMAVWDISGPAPAVFPTLQSWTTAFVPLTALAAGQTVQYRVELFLPTSAGNADQGKTAVVDLHWHAG